MIIKPGDYLVSKRPMWGWEKLHERGTSGPFAPAGTRFLVLTTVNVGEHIRIVGIISDNVCVFSSRQENVFRNWDTVSTGSVQTETQAPQPDR